MNYELNTRQQNERQMAMIVARRYAYPISTIQGALVLTLEREHIAIPDMLESAAYTLRGKIPPRQQMIQAIEQNTAIVNYHAEHQKAGGLWLPKYSIRLVDTTNPYLWNSRKEEQLGFMLKDLQKFSYPFGPYARSAYDDIVRSILSFDTKLKQSQHPSSHKEKVSEKAPFSPGRNFRDIEISPHAWEWHTPETERDIITIIASEQIESYEYHTILGLQRPDGSKFTMYLETENPFTLQDAIDFAALTEISAWDPVVEEKSCDSTVLYDHAANSLTFPQEKTLYPQDDIPQ